MFSARPLSSTRKRKSAIVEEADQQKVHRKTDSVSLPSVLSIMAAMSIASVESKRAIASESGFSPAAPKSVRGIHINRSYDVTYSYSNPAKDGVVEQLRFTAVMNSGITYVPWKTIVDVTALPDSVSRKDANVREFSVSRIPFPTDLGAQLHSIEFSVDSTGHLVKPDDDAGKVIFTTDRAVHGVSAIVPNKTILFDTLRVHGKFGSSLEVMMPSFELTECARKLMIFVYEGAHIERWLSSMQNRRLIEFSGRRKAGDSRLASVSIRLYGLNNVVPFSALIALVGWGGAVNSIDWYSQANQRAQVIRDSFELRRFSTLGPRQDGLPGAELAAMKVRINIEHLFIFDHNHSANLIVGMHRAGVVQDVIREFGTYMPIVVVPKEWAAADSSHFASVCFSLIRAVQLMPNLDKLLISSDTVAFQPASWLQSMTAQSSSGSSSLSDDDDDNDSVGTHDARLMVAPGTPVASAFEHGSQMLGFFQAIAVPFTAALSSVFSGTVRRNMSVHVRRIVVDLENVNVTLHSVMQIMMANDIDLLNFMRAYFTLRKSVIKKFIGGVRRRSMHLNADTLLSSVGNCLSGLADVAAFPPELSASLLVAPDPLEIQEAALTGCYGRSSSLSSSPVTSEYLINTPPPSIDAFDVATGDMYRDFSFPGPLPLTLSDPFFSESLARDRQQLQLDHSAPEPVPEDEKTADPILPAAVPAVAASAVSPTAAAGTDSSARLANEKQKARPVRREVSLEAIYDDMHPDARSFIMIGEMMDFVPQHCVDTLGVLASRALFAAAAVAGFRHIPASDAKKASDALISFVIHSVYGCNRGQLVAVCDSAITNIDELARKTDDKHRSFDMETRINGQVTRSQSTAGIYKMSRCGRADSSITMWTSQSPI